MRARSYLGTVGIVLLLTGLAGCAARPGAPPAASELTMTAILLPERTPTPSETEAPRSTELPVPTATAMPENTAALPTVTLPTVAAATQTALPTVATAAATASATATARPIRAILPTAKPTARPTVAELTGRLVVQTIIGGDLVTVNADGSGLRRLTDGVDPVWSPGGTGSARIAFARWREPRGVWVIDGDGGNERRLFDWNETRWPSWSPDGREVLFSRQNGGRLVEGERCFFGFCFDVPAKPHWRLGLVRVADGSFSEPPSAPVTLAPDWAHDGSSRVVYDGEQGLAVQTLDGSVTYALTDDARDTGPVWSPPGAGQARVAFTRRQHDHWEVYAVDGDGRNLTRLTNTPKQPGGAVGNSAAAAWSPDGRHLAFLTDRSGKWELWVMRADGSGQKPMMPGLDLSLEYSSVGERAISWTE